MFVLDSNIAIAALNNHRNVQERFAAVDASEIGLPAVVVAELLYGAYRSQRREGNLQRVAALRQRVKTLWLTEAILELYASTRAALRVRGVKKTDFDLLIACTALDLDATLVTDDRALLDGSMEGLQVESWLVA